MIEAIKDVANIELEKEYIKIDPVKELGEHKVVIDLGEDLKDQNSSNLVIYFFKVHEKELT